MAIAEPVMARSRVSTNPMPALLARLGEFGVPPRYVRERVLPGWWDDSIADTPLGATQALMLLSRGLALDIDTLADPTAPVAPSRSIPAKLKAQAGAAEANLQPTRCIAISLGEALAMGAPTPVQPLRSTAATARRAILQHHPDGVTLEALLDYCWDAGVPVAHLPERPPKGGKIDGAAVRCGGSDAIVVTKSSPFCAWLLFVVAHELGHVALGHLSQDGAVVDAGVLTTESDIQERDANRFAVELLTGDPDIVFKFSGHLFAPDLARSAAAFCAPLPLDPGAVILNYAYGVSRDGGDVWACANAALKLLSPGADARDVVHSVMEKRLAWEKLPDDTCELVERITARATR